MMTVSAVPDFGCYISEDATFTTENGTIDDISRSIVSFADIFVNVTADHDWGEWTVTKEATAEVEGVETRTCKGCGETETRPIPKLTSYAIT